MKIEIKLDGFIEGSEGEGYRLADVVQDEIIRNIKSQLDKDIEKKLELEIQNILSTSVKEKVDAFIDKELPKLMDYEFKEVTSWGEDKGTFTVRNRILKAFKEQCVYKKERYSQDRNKFTSLVDEIISNRLCEFTKEYQKVIDDKFTEACFEEATARLKRKLKVETK